MNMTLFSELQKNQRLRIGLWLIMGILAVYSLILLDEQHQQGAKDFQAKQQHLVRLQEVVTQTQWSERLMGISQIKVFFEEKLWRANSEGLAKADVQNWLELQAKTTKLENHSVLIESAVDMPKIPRLWMVAAEVRADFSAAALQKALFYLYFNKWVVIERVNASTRGSRPRFSIHLRIYFEKPK